MGHGAEPDDEHRGHPAEDEDPVGVGQAIPAEGELAGHVAVLGQDREQPREGVEAGVRGEEQQQGGERLEEVEHDPVAVDPARDLRDDRLTRELDVGDPEVDGQERDADEQDRQQGRHVAERGRGILRLRRLERRHARRDGLGAGQGDGARGERPQQQDEGERLEGVLDLADDLFLVADALAEDDDPERPHGDHDQRRDHEQVGRDREDVAGLAQAAQVADRDEADRTDPDDDPPVEQARERRRDLLHGGRGRHRDGQHVVDEQGRGRDERDGAPDVPAGDRVRAATGRVGDADLAVADRDDRQQEADRDAHLEAVGERRDAAEDQDAQDLLGRVRRRADRVRAEDRERLLLRQPLAEFVLRCERAADEQAPDRGHPDCPVRVVGALAASLAVSWPGPV